MRDVAWSQSTIHTNVLSSIRVRRWCDWSAFYTHFSAVQCARCLHSARAQWHYSSTLSCWRVRVLLTWERQHIFSVIRYVQAHMPNATHTFRIQMTSNSSSSQVAIDLEVFLSIPMLVDRRTQRRVIESICKCWRCRTEAFATSAIAEVSQFLQKRCWSIANIWQFTCSKCAINVCLRV